MNILICVCSEGAISHICLNDILIQTDWKLKGNFFKLKI